MHCQPRLGVTIVLAVVVTLLALTTPPLPTALADDPPRVFRFEWLRQWAHQPGLDVLNQPYGVAFDRQGYLYVVDQDNHRVVVYDRDGHPVRSMGRLGNGPGELYGPTLLAVDSRGYVYVVDEGNG
ncbi:MAG: hypothetical protein KIT87_25435, partial [Anaerolineae bacterium]|nr:hypothetical protein [Anaerolineae bacterium]